MYYEQVRGARSFVSSSELPLTPNTHAPQFARFTGTWEGGDMCEAPCKAPGCACPPLLHTLFLATPPGARALSCGTSWPLFKDAAPRSACGDTRALAHGDAPGRGVEPWPVDSAVCVSK